MSLSGEIYGRNGKIYSLNLMALPFSNIPHWLLYLILEKISYRYSKLNVASHMLLNKSNTFSNTCHPLSAETVIWPTLRVTLTTVQHVIKLGDSNYFKFGFASPPFMVSAQSGAYTSYVSRLVRRLPRRARNGKARAVIPGPGLEWQSTNCSPGHNSAPGCCCSCCRGTQSLHGSCT